MNIVAHLEKSAQNVKGQNVSEDSSSQIEPVFIGSQPAVLVKVNQPQRTPDKGQSVKNLADDIAKADVKGIGAKLNSRVVRDKAAGGGKGNRNNIAAELKKKKKQEENELKRKKKQEETELKKKQKKEDSELKKKEAAELKKKKQQEEAELNKKKQQEDADLKKAIPTSKSSRSGTIRIPIPTKKSEAKTDELLPESDVERIKEYRLKAVQLSPQGSQRREFHMEKLTRILSSTEFSSLQDLGPTNNMDG
ncbi:Uncharacterized protein Rs2_29051 [Raphanus sativus]|nr:Uncharacterized protein Rs2_29051 [Raphanus sativus]